MNINSAGAGDQAGVIVAENLTKVFSTTARVPGRLGAVRSLIRPRRVARTAVDGVGFRIEPGQLAAFLGPNGAGKSTTVKPCWCIYSELG